SPGKLRYDDALACFLPAESLQSVGVTGAANGRFTLASARREARAEAARSLAKLGRGSNSGVTPFEDELRYTTTGMATDQGKTSNVVALALLADKLAKPIPEVGTTTFRPPYTPVVFGALAGR